MKLSTWFTGLRIGNEPLAVDLERLIACFQAVEDRRHARGRRYPLWLLLTIATLAKLAGMNEIRAVAEWANYRKRELCRLLGFWRLSMPVVSTWTRVFAQAVDVEALTSTVSEALKAEGTLAPTQGSVCVALDGKALRGTITASSPGKHLLALYEPGSGQVLAQMEVDNKANEISAAPQLLSKVDLHGLVVTGDAMFCQRALSDQIREAGGDYLWDVKGNQQRLKEAIATVYEPFRQVPGWGHAKVDLDVATTGYEKGHGRLEKRTLEASSLLQGYTSWPGLAQVFRLETISIHLLTRKRAISVRFGVTSLPHELANAAQLLALVRQHWGIESGLHYRRDVTFMEDRCHTRMGAAAHLNATLNNTTITLLRHLQETNLAAARRLATYLVERLLMHDCFT
jgi:predicted transposase YbfD/YdcC